MSDAVLEACGISFAYDALPVLSQLDLSIKPGEMLSITGVNGSGKTTLLKLFCGLLAPQKGQVLLRGKPIGGLSRREIARHLSLVPQDLPADVAFSVQDIVAMGRNPHLGKFSVEKPGDIAAIEQALAAADVNALAGRPFDELSGGEQKRVFIARALAQETEVILLDEPTANLDVAHQVTLLRLLRRLCQEGRAVAATMHDLSLAATYFDRLAIIAGAKIAACGAPGDVVNEENLRRFFGVNAQVQQCPQFVTVTPLSPVEQTPMEQTPAEKNLE